MGKIKFFIYEDEGNQGKDDCGERNRGRNWKSEGKNRGREGEQKRGRYGREMNEEEIETREGKGKEKKMERI